MKIYKLLIIILAVFSLSLASAQQPGDKIIEVQGKFTPSLNDARKISFKPSLRDTVYQAPNFDYSIIEQKLKTPFEVTPIKPAKLNGEPLKKLYANYLGLGMGNYLTPYFEFYHSNLRSRDTKYGIHYKHFSSHGEITDYALPAWSHNLVEVYGSKFWKKSVMDASITYKRDVNHFYGFQPAEYPDSLYPEDYDIVQRYNLVDADVRLYRYRLKKDEMNYDIRGNYYFLQDFYWNSEHQFALTGQLDWNADFVKSFQKERIGVLVDEAFYSNTWDTLPGLTSNLLTITPFYKFEVGGLTTEFGVDMQVKTDTASEMHFYPELRMNLAAIPNVLYFNFNLIGGHYRNSLKSFSDENPFIVGHIPLNFTNRKYQVNFGLGSSISKAVNFDVQIYYDRLENAPLFITDTNTLYNNQFTAVYDDYDRVKLQMDIAYQKHESLRFLLRGNYYVYNMTNELYPWHKPVYDLSFTTNYNIQDKILFKFVIVSYGSSKVPVWNEGVLSPQTLKSWVDVNLGIEYRYRKKLGLFLNLNNMTASRYYRWYDYPSYKFNFMAGLSYIF